MRALASEPGGSGRARTCSPSCRETPTIRTPPRSPWPGCGRRSAADRADRRQRGYRLAVREPTADDDLARRGESRHRRPGRPGGDQAPGRRRPCDVPHLDVREAFVDVQPPRVDEVVDDVDGLAVVVPLLLTSGFHHRVDIARAARRPKRSSPGRSAPRSAAHPGAAAAAAAVRRDARRRGRARRGGSTDPRALRASTAPARCWLRLGCADPGRTRQRFRTPDRRDRREIARLRSAQSPSPATSWPRASSTSRLEGSGADSSRARFSTVAGRAGAGFARARPIRRRAAHGLDWSRRAPRPRRRCNQTSRLS